MGCSLTADACASLEEWSTGPAFDHDWRAHGHMQRAVTLVRDWARAQAVPGLQLEVIELPGRTPLLWMEPPGHGGDTVLLYGHLDKQPPMHGWSEGLGPWTPVLRDGRIARISCAR